MWCRALGLPSTSCTVLVKLHYLKCSRIDWILSGKAMLEACSSTGVGLVHQWSCYKVGCRTNKKQLGCFILLFWCLYVCLCVYPKTWAHAAREAGDPVRSCYMQCALIGSRGLVMELVCESLSSRNPWILGSNLWQSLCCKKKQLSHAVVTVEYSTHPLSSSTSAGQVRNLPHNACVDYGKMVFILWLGMEGFNLE